MGKWADLPIELMECVEEYLDFVQKVRIRAVCISWNSYLHTVPKLISEDLPWLLLEDNTKGLSLYTVHEAQFYPLNIPEFKNKVFKGSSYGWIITLDDENSNHIDDIYAVNPLTRDVVKLPPRSSFPDVQDFNPHRLGSEYIMRDCDEQDPIPKPEPILGIMKNRDEPELKSESESELESESEPETEQNNTGIKFDGFGKGRVSYYLTHKVLVSSSPTNDDCIAVAIYGELSWLAWCRPYHKRWTSFKGCHGYTHGIRDVIFHDGNLYVLHAGCRLEIYDSIDPQEIVRVVVPEFIQNPWTVSPPMYLAACSNYGVIMASRNYKYYDLRDGVGDLLTTWIDFYKLVEESKTWVQVEDIGENILFIGLNMSSLIPVSDKFKALGYKRNCIYFTDHFRFMFCSDDIEQHSDMAVIDFDEPPLKDFLPGFLDEDQVFWPPPIWLTPSAN